MDKKQKRDLLFTGCIFLSVFFILVSITFPDSETIECKNGLISLNIENKPLETLIKKLGEDCKINILLDQNARNVLINANFKSYPVEYAISKILEGTGLNFITYQNSLSSFPWTVFIGPTKGPGEQATYVEMKTASGNPSPSRNYNYNNSSSYIPPQPARKEVPRKDNSSSGYSAPSYGTSMVIPTAGSYPYNQQNTGTKSEVPTAGSPNTSPAKTSPPSSPHPRRHDPYERRREPPNRPSDPRTIPEQPEQVPNNPVPPNTGSG